MSTVTYCPVYRRGVNPVTGVPLIDPGPGGPDLLRHEGQGRTSSGSVRSIIPGVTRGRGVTGVGREEREEEE